MLQYIISLSHSLPHVQARPTLSLLALTHSHAADTEARQTLIILHQLEEKARHHAALVEFLCAVEVGGQCLWDQVRACVCVRV